MRNQEIGVLLLAGLFESQTFYFPIYMDWRGRFYAQGDFINYQGNKLGLALLAFAEEKEIGLAGLGHLKVHCAAQYGVRGDNEEKLQWFNENFVKLRALDLDLVQLAENIPLFIGALLELNDAFDSGDPTQYKSSFPIWIDCTCSGLQHLAAMLCDVKIAKHVNLTSSKEKGDIYKYAIEIAQPELVKKLGKEVPLSRNMIKKVIMTLPYSAAGHGPCRHLFDNFKFNKQENRFSVGEHPDDLYTPEQIRTITKIILKAFYTEHDSLKCLVEYFKEMANLLTSFGVPISWHTPQGLRITQHYTTFEEKIISSVFKTRKIRINVPAGNIDKKKQAFGIMPNIIHSLDSTNVINFVQALQADVPVLTTHGRLGGRPGDIFEVQNKVKMGFIGVYADNPFLEKLRPEGAEALANLGTTAVCFNQDACGQPTVTNLESEKTFKIPQLPKLGGFNIHDVSNSIYMVCV